MTSSLSHLDRRGDLRVRGSEKTGNLFGQGVVGGQPGELALPEVKIAPGQPIEVGGVVVFGSHGRTIAHRPADGVRKRKALLVALRHRR